MAVKGVAFVMQGLFFAVASTHPRRRCAGRPLYAAHRGVGKNETLIQRHCEVRSSLYGGHSSIHKNLSPLICIA